ncbi:MAG TPA: M23 family metallopeptidase [Kineosporiaceae bacterium]|nr:M23 family metallopeptidase [Kineosporiaceae bacterium]
MRRAVLRAVATGVVGTCLFGAVLAGVGSSASADSVSDRKKTLDQQIAQLRDELEGTSQESADAAIALQRAQAQLVDVQAQLAAAQAAVAKAQAYDDAVASQLAYARAEEAKAITGLQEQQQAEQEIRDRLGLLARETYVNAGDPGLSGLSVALQATSADQFTERLSLASAALQSQNASVDRLAVQQADLRARQVKLSAIRSQVAQLKVQSEAAVSARQAAQAQAQDAEAQQAALVAEQTSALAKIKARQAVEQANLNQMLAEQNKLQVVLAARARAAAAAHGGSVAAPPPPSAGLIGHPVNGPITSGFGMRFHPILHIYRLHTGVDFGVGCGTPVYAVAGGSVVSAGYSGGYGNRIVIDHGWLGGADLATTYNHLSSIVVGSGQVSRGQLIAYSGTTGLSTGCHLHFETLVNGSFVDPMRYL